MQCPSCQKQVDVKDKDVGALFTCPHCRSVYFINFDGTPDFGEVQQPSAEELQRLQNLAIPEKKKKKKSKKDEDESEQQQAVIPEPQSEQTFEAAPAAFEQEVPTVDISQNETPAFEIQPMESFSLSEEQVPAPFEPAPVEPMAVEPMPIEALPTETPSIENFSYEAPIENTAPPVQQQSAPTDFNSIASEIENFGNQQTVVAGISYDLEVTGLDTKEAQELLREAIDDSRFAWHPDDVVREIRTGTCHFKNLTPVQAFVLAKRIQFIDMEMKWKQNVLA